MQSIYLDHNSTTPIHPRVAEAMHECHLAGFVNPASQHRMGQQARQRLENDRLQIARFLGAQTTGMSTDQLIFTSGGTESNNLALIGLARTLMETEGKSPDQYSASPGRIAISSIEHPSLIGAAEQLVRMGFEVVKIPVDSHGVCRVRFLEELIEEDKANSAAGQSLRLVSIMLANNETGVLQPVREAAAVCHKNGVLIHTDAVQAVGKIPVNFRDLDVDAMSFTAHKFSGPRGIGALLLKSGIRLQPILFGGFQQMAMRPGTEDVALATGMAKALELFVEHPETMSRVESLRDQLQAQIVENNPDAIVIGSEEPRVPQTLNVSFPVIDRQAFLLAADIAGLAVSTGSACASGSSEPSPVLMAMRLPADVISGAIRISLGVSNTQAEIVQATERILKIVNDLRIKK